MLNVESRKIFDCRCHKIVMAKNQFEFFTWFDIIYMQTLNSNLMLSFSCAAIAIGKSRNFASGSFIDNISLPFFFLFLPYSFSLFSSHFAHEWTIEMGKLIIIPAIKIILLLWLFWLFPFGFVHLSMCIKSDNLDENLHVTLLTILVFFILFSLLPRFKCIQKLHCFDVDWFSHKYDY